MSTFVEKLFGLNDRVAVVIGGGGYLCSAIARGYAAAGCKIAILDLELQKAITVSEEIASEYSLKTIGLAVNVGKKEDLMGALDNIVAALGPVDILVNGAGKNSSAPFLEMSLEEWYQVLDSQITGTMLGCQVFGEHMLKNGRGSIINISSASASPPLSKAFPYSVAKAGILNLTQNLGREWATLGVRVNAIRPGFFPTEWNRKNFITPERERAILAHTPMGRYGQPEELVGAMIWLASDASGFVTGAEIEVDGGFSCMTI